MIDRCPLPKPSFCFHVTGILHDRPEPRLEPQLLLSENGPVTVNPEMFNACEPKLLDVSEELRRISSCFIRKEMSRLTKR